ncbi:MAG: hypothetical protein HY843_04255 [Bdellovibrio sp.]|nr:hypothetical protein [Bdellovibrio sp.]
MLSPFWKKFLPVILILGALLRLIWIEDLEYKYDEKYIFGKTQTVGVSEHFPLIGMASGVGTVNPGLGLWIFIGLGKVFHIKTPAELTRAVQIINVIALFLLAFFILKFVIPPEKEMWLWGLALTAINPFAVLFSKKIWQQELLPFFCVLFLMSFWKKHTKTGAFFCGLLGIVLGQIHMSGFFLFASVCVWILLSRKSIKFFYWFMGTLVGIVPMLPWIYHIFAYPEIQKAFNHSWELTKFTDTSYWMRWVTGALGVNLKYSLGNHFSDFLTYPIIFSQKTYFLKLIYLLLVISGVSIICKIIYNLYKNKKSVLYFFSGKENNTVMLQNAYFFGSGAIMAICGFTIYMHYFIVTFPMQWVFLARQVLINFKKSKHLLWIIWVSQLIFTIGFLGYIHVKGGAPEGDYGIVYRLLPQDKK